jgi:pimeloyl-ACP methyl ester carboxylesterase
MDDYLALDPSPDDESETQLLTSGAEVFASACMTRSGDFLPYVSTINAASDMDVLRRALNEEQISYLGFSYGTDLGATWATLFPETVRAAVLDAAVDPTKGYIDDLLLQAGGFESSLNAFLTKCNTSQCSFMKVNESAEDAFDRILLSLDQNPISNDGGRVATNQGVAQTGIAGALYGDYQWPQLESALSAADLGDGQPLLILFDEYFGHIMEFEEGDYAKLEAKITQISVNFIYAEQRIYNNQYAKDFTFRTQNNMFTDLLHHYEHWSLGTAIEKMSGFNMVFPEITQILKSLINDKV